MQRLIKALALTGFLVLPSVVHATGVAFDVNGNNGQSGKGAAATSISLTSPLSLTGTGDIVLVNVFVEWPSSQCTTGGISSITTTSGLTFKKRKQFTYIGSNGTNSVYEDMEIWWAYSVNALTTEAVTVNIPACGGHNFDAGTFEAIGFIGFTGTNYFPPNGTPFDANASVPNGVGFTGSAQFPTGGAVTQTATNGLIVNLSGSITGVTQAVGQTTPLNFNRVTDVNNSLGSANFAMFSTQYYGVGLGSGRTDFSGPQTPNWTSATTTDYVMLSDILAVTGTVNPPSGVLGSPSTLMGCCQ